MMPPRILPDKLFQVVDTLTFLPRNLLRHDQVLVLKLRRQLPHKLNPVDDGLKIFVTAFFEVIEINARHVARIRRTQRYASLSVPRVRLENHPREIVESLRKQRGVTRKVSLELREQRHAKQIRQRPCVPRTIEHREHRAVRRVDPVSLFRPLLVLIITRVELHAFVERPIVAHAVDDTDFVTILQIAPNARQFDTYRNLVVLQHVAWTNTRKHQQLRRIERTAGEYHFARRVNATQLAGISAGQRMRAIESFAFEILNTDRPIAIVKQHARREGIELHTQAIRMFARDFQHALARSGARVLACSERNVTQPNRVSFHEPPVIRIELPLKEPAHAFQLLADIVKRRVTRIKHHASQRAIAQRRHRDRLLGAQPSFPTM